MQINGFNKTTLLDYPGHLASTLFLGGCNFRCPYCHNASLVLTPANLPSTSEEDVLRFLKKRVGILEGVCITGGEPTLYPDLVDLIIKIKTMGFLVKLDTNGSNPHILKELVNHGFIDYVAMDIKNSKEKYKQTIGNYNFNIDQILESVSFLLTNPIEYEFRTTVVKELHTIDDFISIGTWIKGANAYYLQAYKDSGDVISPGLSCYNKEELNNIRTILLPFVNKIVIRGIDS